MSGNLMCVFTSGLRFNVNGETRLPAPLRGSVGNVRVPVAGHIGFGFGAVLAGCFRFLRQAATAYHHARHVHVDRKINIANIDKFPT